MNRVSPKKVMEIIYIFIIPLIVLLLCITFVKVEEVVEGAPSLITSGFHYNIEAIGNTDESPFFAVFAYIASALHLNPQVPFFFIVDYITLWFIMFMTWHLLYLPFDTLMHKVLLRKE